MSTFSAIVCDHCDKRDVLEHPPVNGINTIEIIITISGTPAKNRQLKRDLCSDCLQMLCDAIAIHVNQVPRQA